MFYDDVDDESELESVESSALCDPSSGGSLPPEPSLLSDSSERPGDEWSDGASGAKSPELSGDEWSGGACGVESPERSGDEGSDGASGAKRSSDGGSAPCSV